MSKLRKQLCCLYGISGGSSFRIAGASWVALLATRGFTITQISVAEAFFHVVSFLFEIPSGVVADVFGRKRAMILSQCMFVLSAAGMLVSQTMSGLLLAMALDALGYNFASGAREALAYESLKEQGRQTDYERYAANEMMIYRIGNAGAVLCAGVALGIGWRASYGIDLVLALATLCFTLLLYEPQRQAITGKCSLRIWNALRESILFVRDQKCAVKLMIVNGMVGAMATMLLFLLQARLSEIGMPSALLGPALFMIGLGGAVGAQLIRVIGQIRYRYLAIICTAGVLIGIFAGTLPWPLAVCFGGFGASVCDDLLEIRTDVLLNSACPSQQRATLLSVSSLCFSLVMLLVSPFMGLLFQYL